MAAEAAGAARGGEAEAEQHSGRLPENTGETAPDHAINSIICTIHLG